MYSGTGLIHHCEAYSSHNEETRKLGHVPLSVLGFPFENQENLVNGFHVQASIEIIDNLSKIPTSALVKTDDEVYVFKVIDGILKKQNVEIVSSNDELTVIKSGLDKNDIIVKYPIDNMKEGDPINFYNSDEGTDKAIE